MRDKATLRNLIKKEKENVLEFVREHDMITVSRDGYFNKFKFRINNVSDKTQSGIWKGSPRVDMTTKYQAWNDEILMNILRICEIMDPKKVPWYMKDIKEAYDDNNGRIAIEYPDFCKDPEIGSYKFWDNIEDGIRVVTCHEIAHTIQFWNREEGWDDDDVHDKHNDVWKKSYRFLRKGFGLVSK